jgi:hypothetical protein
VRSSKFKRKSCKIKNEFNFSETQKRRKEDETVRLKAKERERRLEMARARSDDYYKLSSLGSLRIHFHEWKLLSLNTKQNELKLNILRNWNNQVKFWSFWKEAFKMQIFKR